MNKEYSLLDRLYQDSLYMTLLKVLSIAALTFLIAFIALCSGILIWTTYDFASNENLLCSFPEEEIKNNENVQIKPNLMILGKKEWGGMCSRHGLIHTNVPATLVIICHTATKQCATKTQCAKLVKSFQNNHVLDRKFPDVDYNFIVGGDGNIYIGSGWNLRRKLERIKIAFIGNYAEEKFEMFMIEILLQILDYGLRSRYLDPKYELTAHNLTLATLSPGENIYKMIKRFERFSDRVLY